MPVTNFFWDGDNLLQEYDDAGVTTAQYSTEPDSFGNTSSQRRGGQSHYYHHDPLGSTTELTNASGDVTDTRRYKAFGETVEQSGSTTFAFQYVGQKGYYFDPERGTHYIRRRDLRSTSGRWTAVDPIRDARPNSYEYVGNNPVNAQDPSGLACTFGWASIHVRQTSVADLDDLAKEGKPYTDALNEFLAREQAKYRPDFPVTKVNLPSLDRFGPGIVFNKPFPLPPKAYAIAYWARAVSIGVCEDAPGDCEFGVYETWKYQEHAIPDPDRKGWVDTTAVDYPGKQMRHEAIARMTPLVHPGNVANVMIFEPKKFKVTEAWECCARQRVILHVDLPNLEAHLKLHPDFFPKTWAARNSILQENVLFEKGNDTPVYNAETSWRLGVNIDGTLIES
jgi:RHS repeat-associated protein